jgi:hypothetical protein
MNNKIRNDSFPESNINSSEIEIKNEKNGTNYLFWMFLFNSCKGNRRSTGNNGQIVEIKFK